tara:strand:+ start:4347 stop:4763 length:417 start_codon:yes stop_codon:yes gene_type:complete
MVKKSSLHVANETGNPLLKIFWISIGLLFVGLGAIGAIIPGMPTTVFLVLAAACFIRSSQKLYDWLIKNKTFGPYLKDYREGKGIPLKAKVVALILITIFVSYAVFFAIQSIPLRVLVGAIGLIGFWFVSFKVPAAKT